MTSVIRMTESRDLISRPFLPLLVCLPPILVRDALEVGAYVDNFCADGRFSRPILPLLDYRPPSLVRVLSQMFDHPLINAK